MKTHLDSKAAGPEGRVEKCLEIERKGGRALEMALKHSQLLKGAKSFNFQLSRCRVS